MDTRDQHRSDGPLDFNADLNYDRSTEPDTHIMTTSFCYLQQLFLVTHFFYPRTFNTSVIVCKSLKQLLRMNIWHGGLAGQHTHYNRNVCLDVLSGGKIIVSLEWGIPFQTNTYSKMMPDFKQFSHDIFQYTFNVCCFVNAIYAPSVVQAVKSKF